MAMPKPILVTILIMAAVAVVFAVVIFRMIPATTPDQQAVPEKLEAPANQGVSAKSVQEFRQAHPDAFVIEVFGEGNFTPTIDQADDNVRIWCLDSRGEATMSAAEFAARSCQPAAALGIYGGGFAGVNFGIKREASFMPLFISGEPINFKAWQACLWPSIRSNFPTPMTARVNGRTPRSPWRL